NEDYLKLYNQYKKAWDYSEKVKSDPRINIENEWDIFQKKANAIKTRSKKIKLRPLYKIAAIFIIGLFTALGLYISLNQINTNTVIADNKVVENKLPDGSVVTLNANSKIKYDKKFKEDKRRVILKGDAYFDVIPEKTRTFEVKAQDIIIEVLGTSFYVNADKKSDYIEVIVHSGKVAVYKENDPANKTILLPGNKAVYKKRDKVIEKLENKDINFLSWKTKKLKFRNDKLTTIVKTLNKTYNVNIIIESEEIEKCRITTSFDDQSLEAVLRVLESLLDIKIEKADGAIRISGKGC
ncbi:FecR family protein, partial [Bacteroidota bacterium]